MGLEINRITNANVYVDGNSLLGQVEEMDLPDIKAVMAEHKAMGMVGKMEFPSGIDKLTAKMKFNSFYPKIFKKIGNMYQAVQMQIRSNVESYQGGSRTAQLPYKVFITAQFTNIPTGMFKAMDNVEFEANLSVTRIKVEHNGTEILEFDANANVWRVDGVDLLAQYRANLGI